jgi:hypothetical protein
MDSSLALQIMCVIVGTFFCFGWFFGALADSSDYVCGGDFPFLVGVKWSGGHFRLCGSHASFLDGTVASGLSSRDRSLAWFVDSNC